MRASVQKASALPRGRHNLSREAVEADQRRRLLEAVCVAGAEHGYALTTVAQVIDRAGVSRRTFYEHFDGREECLLAAYDDLEERLFRCGAAAIEGVGKWPARVEAAVSAGLQLLASEPASARLLTLEARAAGPRLIARHRQALDRLAALLRAGRRGSAVSLPERTEQVLVDGAAGLVGSYITRGAAPELPRLAPELAGFLLVSYFGDAAGRRDISSSAAAGPR